MSGGIRIFGIGSPLGDDQAGWLTIDALLARGMGGDEMVIEKLDRPGANLIPLLDDAGWVILVDAMRSGNQPGCIKRFDARDWPAYGRGLSSHGLGVLDALLLARALGGLPPRLDLYGIEIGPAGPGDKVGNAVQAAIRRLARHIAADLSTSVQLP